ncbi:FAD/NAD(P)-binding oxidoreductase [Capilliphycus salinus ALCB114379]|uniref:NAD(P)/FAD-dependent oxidoreductase n=1 Tax=Capilliphycus salinus TaxID=2768948 RepID=UPI0039A6A823
MSNSTVQNTQSTGRVTDSTHYQIVIIGGGAGGITVASQLLKKDSSLNIAIIEPSEQHYYQPAWTLVGAGAFALEDTIRNEKDCIPQSATWIKAYAETFEPENNIVITRDGKRIHYDYLVVCPGIQINWHEVEGLPEALGKGGVTSNYSKDYAPYTWELLKKFSGGTAIFTYPATPIKCGGAPQKIMYLADDTFRKNGVRNKSKVIYCSAGASMFPVADYCESLDKIVERREIDVKFKHNLKQIKPDSKEAIFEVTTDTGVERVSLKYDFIHVAPPMSAPDFIKNSLLAASSGWVDVDKNTLQHNRYPNIFSLGDASSLPTSRTAAAIRKQAPVVVENLYSLVSSQSLKGSYGGYTCCPLVTGYGKTIMAEFDYENKPKSSFPMNPAEERYSMWLVKRHLLPWLYWNRMLKGASFEGDLLKFLQKK